MNRWRLDRVTATGIQTDWYPTEADADRALWRLRMGGFKAHALVWEDLASYEMGETA